MILTLPKPKLLMPKPVNVFNTKLQSFLASKLGAFTESTVGVRGNKAGVAQVEGIANQYQVFAASGGGPTIDDVVFNSAYTWISISAIAMSTDVSNGCSDAAGFVMTVEDVPQTQTIYTAFACAGFPLAGSGLGTFVETDLLAGGTVTIRHNLAAESSMFDFADGFTSLTITGIRV